MFYVMQQLKEDLPKVVVKVRLAKQKFTIFADFFYLFILFYLFIFFCSWQRQMLTISPANQNTFWQNTAQMYDQPNVKMASFNNRE